MKAAPALLAFLAAAAAASAPSAQTLSLQGSGDGPAAAAVDPATVQGLPSTRDYRPPAGVTFKAADLFSDNVRLTAQWFYATESEGRPLPTVIMAPGWGATAATLREDAEELARAGYLVLLFDYRGWGESDGRLITGASHAEARQVRGYIDPWEQSQDWFNAISYAQANPMVDPASIGLRGADLAGGYVIDAAAHDPRVKAVVSEVTWADLRPSKPYQPNPDRTQAEADAAAAQLATGQAPYPAERAHAGARIGAPMGNKLVRWRPVEAAGDVTQPALFVLAEKEELFSNVFNGQMACERVQGARKMIMLPKVGHYDVYGLEHARALAAAIDWFDKYLKPPAPAAGKTSARKDPERGPCNPPPLPPKGEEPKDGSGQGHKSQNTSTRFN